MRRREEDRRPARAPPRGRDASLDRSLGAVVARRDDVRVDVDEAGSYRAGYPRARRCYSARGRARGSGATARSSRRARASSWRTRSRVIAELGADLLERLRRLAVEAEAEREHVRMRGFRRVERAGELARAQQLGRDVVSGWSEFVSSIRSPYMLSPSPTGVSRLTGSSTSSSSSFTRSSVEPALVGDLLRQSGRGSASARACGARA